MKAWRWSLRQLLLLPLLLPAFALATNNPQHPGTDPEEVCFPQTSKACLHSSLPQRATRRVRAPDPFSSSFRRRPGA